MVHWQIKLIDWQHGHTKWHGQPVREKTQYPGMWIDRIEPYIYNTLEEARFIKSGLSSNPKNTYDIRIIKITPKSKRKR